MKDKIAGTIYGMALGDAMGMPSELWSRRKVKSYFGKITNFLDGPKENIVAANYKRGQFTDDTSQALAILNSLEDTHFTPNKEDIAIELLDWADRVNAFENNMLGPTSKAALMSYRKNENPWEIIKNAQSNGSAMRIAPIGCLFSSQQKKELTNYVAKITKTTHGSDVTIAGAAMIAMAVSSAMENNNFSKIVKDSYEVCKYGLKLGNETISPSLIERTKLGVEFAKNYKQNDEAFLNKLYEVIGAGVGITEAVPAALSIAYYAQEPNKCALLCANLGGDTDTIGAMATAICGAYTGYSSINIEYIEVLNSSNDVDFMYYVNLIDKYRNEI